MEKVTSKSKPVILEELQEEAQFLGRISLGKLKVQLDKSLDAGITAINFSGNGYITDAVLRVLCEVINSKPNKDKSLGQLTQVDLTGCFHVTDTGVTWIAAIVKDAPKLKKVCLDGCVQITDSGISALLHAKSSVKVSAIGTSVTFINLDVNTLGCQLLADIKHRHEKARLDYGHCLIVPDKGLDVIFAEYLSKKTVSPRAGSLLSYVKEWTTKTWKMSLLETELSNPMFDLLVPPSPGHVLIPVSIETDTKEISNQVTRTVTRVLAKEMTNPRFYQRPAVSRNKNQFMDIHKASKLEITAAGVIRTQSKPDAVYVSRQPLSRTNPYYEIHCVKLEEAGSDAYIVLGCIFETQFKTDQPKYDSSLPMEKFDLMEGDVFGFGVDTEWTSEYVPDIKNGHFYFIRNGEMVLESMSKMLPREGMYPVVIFGGKGKALIKLKNFQASSKTAGDKKNVRFEPGSITCVDWDETGVLRLPIAVTSDGGATVNRLPITQDNNTCSIRILDMGEAGKISIGMGRENVISRRMLGSTDDTLGFRADGKVYQSGKVVAEPISERAWQVGDEVTVTVTGFSGEIILPSETVDVTLTVGGTKVAECKYRFSSQYGNRCCFMVGLCSKNERVKILDFRPPYFAPPPVMNQLTMGRHSYLKLTDDSILSSCRHTNITNSSTSALFTSKTPINKSLTYFEVKLLQSDSVKTHYIGLTSVLDRVPDGTLGRSFYSISYSGSDGKLWNRMESFSKTIDVPENVKLMIVEGDVLGCGVEGAEFTSEGLLKSYQDLDVYFTKNGVRIHQAKYMYGGSGLFPCVTFHRTGDQVKLHNYYPHPYPPGTKTGASEPKEKQADRKADGQGSDAEGCQFTVVCVGTKSGSQDEKNKLQQIKNQLNLEQDLTLISDIKAEIQQIQKNLDTLNFQGHQYYSRLCWNLECLERFCKQKTRLKFVTVNTDTGEGYDGLVDRINSIQDVLCKLYPQKYNFHPDLIKFFNNFVSTVTSKAIVTDADSFSYGGTNISKLRFCRIASLLHSLGRVVELKISARTYAIDPSILVKMFEHISKHKLKNMKQDKCVTAVQEGTCVYPTEAFFIRNFNKEQNEVYRFLQSRAGILQLPYLRTDPKDPLIMFTRTQDLVAPSKNLSDYWSHGSKPKDCACMWKTYNFWSGIPSGFLTAVVVECSKIAHLQLVQEDGAVLQNGAVQTTIIKHTTQKGDALTVESKCFVPDRDVGPIQEDTRFNVEEYTWNVFCILTDVVDSHIHNSSLTPIIEQKTPKHLANTSIGCVHDWSISDSPADQSVCTLCELCCDKGPDCEWNGIMGYYLRQCRCGTSIGGCKSCGICMRCAQHLWTLRSMLRPCSDISLGQNLNQLYPVAIDGNLYDEVEIVNCEPWLKRNTAICLKRHDDDSDSFIQLLPSTPSECTDLKEQLATHGRSTYKKTETFMPGETVSLWISKIQKDPTQFQEVEEVDDAILDIKPVYYTHICREVRVWHETGILCNDSLSGYTGQFIAAKPLTPDCSSFSIEIIGKAKQRVGIGLVSKNYPSRRMPGWEPQSVAYHADDGGIFINKSSRLLSVEKSKTGDRLTCKFDFKKNIAVFYKGETELHRTEELNVPATGFYPAVGMTADGEAVQLLETDPWLPPAQGELPPLPETFDTYKYGNLWISPGHTLFLQKYKQSSGVAGWLLLYNPSTDLIGYVVSSEPSCISYAGAIEPKRTAVIWINSFSNSSNVFKMKTAEIIWFSLDSGKSYSSGEVKTFLNSLTPDQSHGHLLKVKAKAGDQSKESMTLKKTSQTESKKDVYTLHVRRNGSLDKYYLKAGKYSCVVPYEKDSSPPRVLIRRPRAPSFDLAGGFQRGMRLVAQVDKNLLAECVITSVTPDGSGLSLEYSPKDSDENQVLKVKVTSKTVQLEKLNVKPVKRNSRRLVEADVESDEDGDKSKSEKSEHSENKEDDKDQILKADIKLQAYENRGNMMIEKRAMIYPPPGLLTESSYHAIPALDLDWHYHFLQDTAKCNSLPSRLTVQELQICDLSRKLPNWFVGKHTQSFVFLPPLLDISKLCHNPVLSLFHEINAHRLCLLVDQMTVNHRQKHKTTLDTPLHFVNIPPVQLTQSLPSDLLVGCQNSGWTYTALIASKLTLPVYDQIFAGSKLEFSRAQIERMLWYLLRIYASQCHLMAEHCGGLDLQESFSQYVREVKKRMPSEDKNVGTFTGKPFEDPSILMIHPDLQWGVCKSHQMTMKNTELVDTAVLANLKYDHKYFDPYNETVNYISRELPEQKSLPDDFFLKFPNLQFLELERCRQMDSLPSGISKCERLTTFVLQSGNIKHLPDDLFLVPGLTNLLVNNLLVTDLPSKWPESSRLTKLSLKGLQLTKVPPELFKLSELQDLDLSCNPITTIPHDLRKLQKLHKLNLSGMPWMTVNILQQHSRPTVTKSQYLDWCKQNPFIATHLAPKTMEELFDECDVERNESLKEDQLADLNKKLFWGIPRIGSNCITDEEFGGIPPAVFQMSSLKELHLNFTAITNVPVHMCRLVHLQHLSLYNNPLLESLPGSLGHMPNLKYLSTDRCPSLRTPPSEVVSRGFESVRAYLKRLSGGFNVCWRTKLMLVGLGGAGKTSLLKALMSESKSTQGTKGEEITDGIAIQPWKVTTQNNLELTYSAWDFAGQTLYYNTHQFFLSKRAVYLLLWSTRQGFEHAGLDFWLNSIASHAPETPIFVIGTHYDKVPKADIPTAELTKKYPQIVGFHFVSSTEGTGIPELEKHLLKVTLEQPNMGEKIPQVWLNLEKLILEAREKTSILQWKVIKKYGVDVGLYDDKDIREALEFLHELGTVQYFDNDFLRDQVVINPQWIVNVMSCVVSVKNSPIQEGRGRFQHKDIAKIWQEYPKSLHRWLLQLTEEFDLTFPLPKETANIVPCLLPAEEPAKLEWPAIPMKGEIRQTKMVYKFSYLPAGLFNRAQVRLFQLSDNKQIWKRGSLLKKNNHLALIRQVSNCELIVLVQGQRPENILFLVHEIFESLIEESFHGVVYDYLVPCPDCVMKEGSLEPSLFDAKLVYSAKDMKAPFLQCRKYFHTVSMAQLLESLPDAHTSDFDAHLQHSIMMLQELNSELTTDVAILYSALDVPAPKQTGDKIHPQWVKNDLEKKGLTVWFCEDMGHTSTQELMLALKNCRVVVALVSDNFERDEKSRDLMLYVMNGLHKEYIIMAVGEGMAWQNTNLGMMIGKQELMVMAKTKSRYGERVKELQDMVKSRLKISQKTNAPEYPVCFISYCWCNSRDAVKKGTKEQTGSLGWGDPRQIKTYLEEQGISVWLDNDQVTTGKGLFENITQGMRYSKVLVACVSDQYAESVNCMMELRFGILNLNLPVILAVVGTGNEWQYTEVGGLARRTKAQQVYFQTQSSTAHNQLLQCVQKALPSESEMNKMRQEALKQEATELQQKATASLSKSVVFQEEYELTQRRFMRHIISFISSMDSTPLPRLIVTDFEKAESLVKERDPTTRPTLRPKTASRTRDRLEIGNIDTESWTSQKFCLRLLCEFEEGWHLCEQSFVLKTPEDLTAQMKKVAPYLFRTFSILKQSSVQLNCFSGNLGREFLEWLEKESENSNFLEAYQAMRTMLEEQEKSAASFIKQMSRCHLPSGKMLWLCEEHSSGPRITKLSRDTGTRLNQRRVLFPEDNYLKELIEKSDVYKKKRKETHKTDQTDMVPEEEKPQPNPVQKEAATENLSSPPEGSDNSNDSKVKSELKIPEKESKADKSKSTGTNKNAEQKSETGNSNYTSSKPKPSDGSNEKETGSASSGNLGAKSKVSNSSDKATPAGHTSENGKTKSKAASSKETSEGTSSGQQTHGSQVKAAVSSNKSSKKQDKPAKNSSGSNVQSKACVLQ